MKSCNKIVTQKNKNTVNQAFIIIFCNTFCYKICNTFGYGKKVINDCYSMLLTIQCYKLVTRKLPLIYCNTSYYN